MPPIASAIALALLLVTAATAAEFYRWVDERGVVHFTDSLHAIPQSHRKSVTRIKVQGPRETASPSTRTTVPIQKKGEVVIVPATLNQKSTAFFVLDTGASYTMLSRATATALGLDLEKRPTVALQTANGQIQAPLVSLDTIDVGGLQIKNVTAAVHDVFPDGTIAGLLGLNFLRHFRLDIDTQNGLLTLEHR